MQASSPGGLFGGAAMDQSSSLVSVHPGGRVSPPAAYCSAIPRPDAFFLSVGVEAGPPLTQCISTAPKCTKSTRPPPGCTALLVRAPKVNKGDFCDGTTRLIQGRIHRIAFTLPTEIDLHLLGLTCCDRIFVAHIWKLAFPDDMPRDLVCSGRPLVYLLHQ